MGAKTTKAQKSIATKPRAAQNPPQKVLKKDSKAVLSGSQKKAALVKSLPKTVKAAASKALAAKAAIQSAAQNMAQAPVKTAVSKVQGAIKASKTAAKMVATEVVVAATSPSEPTKIKAEGPSRTMLKKIEAKIREEGAEASKRWEALFEQFKKMRAVPYNMSSVYEVSNAIQHKILGWGIVLEARNDRAEVLFKDGIKTLIMNYRR